MSEDPVEKSFLTDIVSSIRSLLKDYDYGQIIWFCLILGVVSYFLYQRFSLYLRQKTIYNPVRLSALEDKLKQRRLLQQQSWQAQSAAIYQQEQEEKKMKKRQRAEEKHHIQEDKEEFSEDEDLRAMLTKHSKKKSGFQPNWLDSNYNSGSGPRNVRSLPKAGRNCGPSS
jgi:activator of 2-hydroxyglutaryl-CoA dehydratase